MDAIVKPLRKSMEEFTQDTQRPTRQEAEDAVRTLIAWAGDDPSREGLTDTPKRIINAYEELYKGYQEDAHKILERTFEDVGGYNDIVIIRDIPFYSHCEHHMLPFVGKAQIGYYPNNSVVGLSKLARVVDTFARRLQTQENLTRQIINTIDSALQPQGTAVLLEAEHMCMALRGVMKSGVSTVTTQFTGTFHDDPAEQSRFLQLIYK